MHCTLIGPLRILLVCCFFSGVLAWADKPAATPAKRISIEEGFKVELLYSVPREEQGSWVNLTSDPQGRLIVSDQFGSLYRVTPGKERTDTKVERLDIGIGAAQGLLCAFDSLYVVVNGDAAEGSGLYRVRDTDGDDQYDEVLLLRSLPGSGEHGPHAVLLAPDGKSLLVCAGNHTDLPQLNSSLVPQNWQEDQLLPRMWDAGGHAVGRLAPGGWICRTDPEGKTWELVSSGYRNEFDAAFNQTGELFTFDADMEWDIGLPWYRPTRICHVTSGSEFGWRSGSGKWPAYYPDSLPAAVDIGPGSPTGITFGTGAKFPAKYQQALFACDWSFGVLYAVHLQPDGASYTGEFERFATASPLPLTDVIVSPNDGAIYFTTGGRLTQSGLYRITYVGDESTEPVERKTEAFASARALRHKLESYHGTRKAGAVEKVWPYLAHEDRFIRYAARVAIEHQPVELWRDRALGESEPWTLLQSMIALARCGDESDQPALIQELTQLDLQKLQLQQQLALLRAYGLACIRMGEPSPTLRKDILEQVDGYYPAKQRELNQELARLLIYLKAPEVSDRTLELLASAKTQEEQIHYVYCLRSLEAGWSLEQRREYFAWFNQVGDLHGGASFAAFLQNIRNEAVELLSEEQRAALTKVLSTRYQPGTVPENGESRPLVKKWNVEELLPVDGEMADRDLEHGRQVFAAASCYKCHRFQGEGGIIGPDLTSVGKRFTDRYLLESLIEPSKAISDQYQATVFMLDSGRTVVGKIANMHGEVYQVITNMLEPGNFTQVRASKIEEQRASEVSMMPTGLLDTFEREEILDMLAFLKSGSGERHSR